MYAQMEKKGFRPDRYTFPFVLKACTKLSWVNVGCGVHGKIMKHGYEDNAFARNTLIYFHANVRDIKIASALFDYLGTKQVVAWSALTTGYARRGTWAWLGSWVCNGGLHKESLDMFEEMTSLGERPDERHRCLKFEDHSKTSSSHGGEDGDGGSSSSASMNCHDCGNQVKKYCQHMLCTPGCGVHGKIMKHGYEDNAFARNTLIYFHANVGDIKIASALFDYLGTKQVVAWSALTTGYARRGTWRGVMESARVLFDQVSKRDVVTRNAMIAGYVNGGLHKEALDMFEEMTSLGERPDEVTMLGERPEEMTSCAYMLCSFSSDTGVSSLRIARRRRRAMVVKAFKLS
nr:hypothetical protein [Tanacetum cinerariifolium]